MTPPIKRDYAVLARLPTLLPEPSNLAQARAALAEDPALAKRFSDAVTVEDREVDGATAGAPRLRVRVFRPKAAAPAGTVLPALLWLHGGGFYSRSMQTSLLNCFTLAKDANCVVVLVEYRLAPEAPYPAAFDDCYAALCWLASGALEGVDTKRLALGGESAGGSLTLSVALKARDDGPKLTQLLVIYPVVDNALTAQSARDFTDAPVINAGFLVNMWTMYLGPNFRSTTSVSAFAAPARSKNVFGLPPTYMEVCEADPLRDEGLDFARRLLAAGVPLDLVLHRGAPHGFDVLTRSPTVQRAFQERARVIREAFWPVAKL